MLPQLHRHAWMDESIEAFREQVRRWIAANGGWERNLLLITADHETGYLTGPSPAEGPAPACPAALPLLRRGAGNLPGLEFHSRNHTNALVPLLAAGAGSERLPGLAGHRDPVRGPYLDNTAIGLLLQDLAAH